MRIGIFGGSFDPIHQGHLIMAEQCREQGRLDQVWFVPAARPPHKQGKELASFSQRVEMLTFAISGQPEFVIKELEKDRPGPSYTVDTLCQIKTERPDDELFLIIGGDTLRDFPNWRQPNDILALANLLVVDRPGWELPTMEAVRSQLGGLPEEEVRAEMVSMPLIDISSTDIRQRCRESRSVRYLVPRAVEVYMGEKTLYA